MLGQRVGVAVAYCFRVDHAAVSYVDSNLDADPDSDADPHADTDADAHG